MKLVQWSFGRYGTEGYVTNKELALTKNLTIRKGCMEVYFLKLEDLDYQNLKEKSLKVKCLNEEIISIFILGK